MEQRRYPIGAEVQAGEGVHFRVWAPARKHVEAVLCNDITQVCPLEPEGNGYFSALAAGAGAGVHYQFRLDGEKKAYPDPASRFQPDGPEGPAQVVDPGQFHWSDQNWRGVDPNEIVLYEMHIGTFTVEGTWAAATQQLPALAEMGITMLEVMPVADFAGHFGWGYDGVNLFAPTRLYGQPDEFRAFVNAAHQLGIGVILDVVYNHLGPAGNYLPQFAPQYFTKRYANEWGEAINFDGPDSGPVREFFAANAAYWIDEFHLDGLRLDATQQIYDTSSEHILTVISQRVRQAAGPRRTYLVAENEPQHPRLVRPIEKGGHGLDALWNDDFHHSATVALTGHNEAYYTDYHGTPQELLSAIKWGYLYQGQRYAWQKQRRGTPGLDLPPGVFINFLQNHDQIANSGRGLRCHQQTSPGRYRALTALFLLAPGTPMLFQGQEFGASSPFFYFADHHPELAKLVSEGRSQFLRQFPALAQPGAQSQLPNPADAGAFQRSKLDLSERERNVEMVALHRDLLRLRREEPVLRQRRPRGIDGAVLGDHAFLVRFFAEDAQDRLLVVNLGRDLHLNPAPEPLLAPPEGCHWELAWSSEEIRYGGCGTPPVDSPDNWRIPGEAAVFLVPQAGLPEDAPPPLRPRDEEK